MSVSGACGPVAIHVDLDALIALQADLETIRGELAAMDCGAVTGGAGVLGGVDVADAVDGFVDGWREGRERITEELTQCVSGLGDAISAYEQSEAALRSAVTPTGS